MSFITNIFGWKFDDETKIPSDSCIYVMAHSSYWDIFVGWLFTFYPSLKNLHFIVKPQFQELWYWPIRSQMKFIYASRLEDKGTGTIEKIFTQYKNIRSSSNNPVQIILSPKGTIQNKEWRSGYYYLAKMANLKIYPMIVNYSTRTIKIGEPVDPSIVSLEDAKENLQKQLGTASILNMKNAEYTITDTSTCPYESLFPFDFCALSLLPMIPYIIGLMQQGYIIQTLLATALFVVAWKYHLDYEGTLTNNTDLYQKLEANLAIITMANHVLYYIFINGRLPSIFILCSVIGLFFYLNAIPRGFKQKREKYVVFHSIYHILSIIAAFSLLN